MRINTNVSSLAAQEAAANVNKNLSSSLEKLSTGLRINKASDDASGMAIADKLRTQASSVGQGIANANAANTLIQMADKAMGEQSNILDIVKTKLMQAVTSTTSDKGREAILNDVQALLTQFDAISTSTQYNGTSLLDGSNFDFKIGELTTDSVKVNTSYSANTDSMGSDAGRLTEALVHTTGSGFAVKQVDDITYTDGATGDWKAGDTATIEIIGEDDKVYSYSYTVSSAEATADDDTAAEIEAVVAAGLATLINAETANGVIATNANTTGGLTITADDTDKRFDITSSVGKNLSGLVSISNDEFTADVSADYLAVIDGALDKLNTVRSEFGSGQNQVESAIRNMMTMQTNLKAAESIIRDVDYAAESANFNKQNIIAQAGTYAISQANQVQQNVLRLLQ